MGKVKTIKTKRVLRIIGEINFELLAVFCEELAVLESESSQPITIELCSEGGDAYAGIAFYTKIVGARSHININAFGCIMSAATIILAAGDTRHMHKDCWFMVHDECQKIRADNGKIAVAEAKHQENFEVHWAEILCRHSGGRGSLDYWRQASLGTSYLTAVQCKDLGLVHEIY